MALASRMFRLPSPRSAAARSMGWLWLGIAISIIMLDHWGVLNRLEWAIRDQWVQQQTATHEESDIIIVTIDEQDIQHIGDWPIPDRDLATALRKIHAQGPTAIGLDLYRNLPEEPGHQDLLAAYQTIPELVGIEKIAGDRVPPPPVLAERGQVAIADLLPDPDGTIRRALLSAHDAADGDRFKLGLGASVALQHLAKFYDITPESLDQRRQLLQLGKTRFVPLRNRAGGYADQDAEGYQILLHWWSNTNGYTQVRLRDVLTDRVATDLMRDRIVLIGSTASSTNDLFGTPYSTAIFQANAPMPGVFIHANITSQLLKSALTGRPSLRSFTRTGQWLWILAWAAWGTLGSGQWIQTKTANSWWHSRVLWFAVLSLSSLGLGSSVAFAWSLVIPVTAPGLAFGLGVLGAVNVYKQQCLIQANQTLKNYTQKLADLNAAYEHFVPNQFLELLEKKSIVDVRLGEQTEREMTILFSDIRNFTRLSEQMNPAENFAFINQYLSYMEPQIKRYRGFIDKYIGDAIMALFPYSADDALASAIAMLRALDNYNLEQKPEQTLRIGIGIHTGRLMLGTVGGVDRMDGTVIGNSVNLASRVENLTKEYGVSLLITQQTLAGLDQIQDYDLRFIDQLKARGKTEAIALFEVFSADNPDLRMVKNLTKSKFEQGILLFKQAKYEEAGTLFQYCLTSHDGDRVAAYYLQKCELCLQESSDTLDSS